MRDVAEHFLQRHLSANHNRGTRCFLALDHATTTVEIAHHVTDVIIRCGDFHVHDRLKNHRTGVLHAFTEASLCRDFERQSGRVNVMVLTVEQGELEVHGREACQHTTGSLNPDALFYSRNVFLRNRSADNLVLELDLAFMRSELDLHFSELTRTTRLLLMGIGLDVRLRDRLTVSNLRCANVRFNAVFTTQTVNDDVEMQLAHAGQNGLACFLICLQTQ